MRIRGRKLQRINRLILQEHPLCAMCEAEGRVVAAQEVDHIQPLWKGGTNERRNLQPLCIPHHRAKSLQERWPRPSVGEDGWPL
jgi:5-methylcytosine-specific restriction protein A